jgi:hypothetical protein
MMRFHWTVRLIYWYASGAPLIIHNGKHPDRDWIHERRWPRRTHAALRVAPLALAAGWVWFRPAMVVVVLVAASVAVAWGFESGRLPRRLPRWFPRPWHRRRPDPAKSSTSDPTPEVVPST